MIVRPEGSTMYEHSERKYTLLLLYLEMGSYETVYEENGFKVYAAAGQE